ncbi:DJ-1/PfpI family protein [Actinocrispum wychmicini]|uniref:DJ-1/PfpI family protein n=1 Tax=Actinocrispum wychmicini TaxID=1213861 RepID=A0A4R2JZV4_9PSEU|nr:DJ-1/PfpI family protein [Actinocrispum wychmicini]TCO62978.1 DJ-1/PfpI family protein [Actinocrispum wychmicini]
MKIAILIFDRFTALDAVGPYEVLSWLPNADLVFVGERKGPVRAHTDRLAISADATFDEVPEADILVIPGGPGQQALMEDSPTHEWIRAVDSTSTWTTTVCTGSLILAATGLLKDRKATTHWHRLDQLATYGAIPTSERVVFDDKYVTAAGVSAGIDMALTLTAKTAGETLAQKIQLLIEYDPQPPFKAGHPKTAPQEILNALLTP